MREGRERRIRIKRPPAPRRRRKTKKERKIKGPTVTKRKIRAQLPLALQPPFRPLSPSTLSSILIFWKWTLGLSLSPNPALCFSPSSTPYHHHWLPRYPFPSSLPRCLCVCASNLNGQLITGRYLIYSYDIIFSFFCGVKLIFFTLLLFRPFPPFPLPTEYFL